jgi:integrase/recombinase XerD
MDNRIETPFTDLIAEFITFKRTEGYKYDSESDTLSRFDSFLAEMEPQNTMLTKEIMDVWCRQGLYESRKSFSNRVATIRQFAIYLLNRGYQVPVPDTIKKATNKLFVPYVFSDDEMKRIFWTVDHLPPGRQSNSDVVYPILFRVLYGCGLRISEALSLKIEDVDLVNGILIIRNAKYDKKRLVPMSESLTRICREYSDKWLKNISQDQYFFRKKYGGCRDRETVNKQFRKIMWKSEIPYMGKGKGPRLHDIRHTFCCHSMKQMSDNKIDLYCGLPVLSAYVGHSSIQATERYLRLTLEIYPELEGKMCIVTGGIFPEVFCDAETN